MENLDSLGHTSRAAALVILAAHSAIHDTNNLALDMRTNFNNLAVASHIMNIAFPEIKNIKPGEADIVNITTKDVSEKLDTIIEWGTDLKNKEAAAFACVLLNNVDTTQLAFDIRETFHGQDDLSKKILKIFPDVPKTPRGDASFHNVDGANVQDAIGEVITDIDNAHQFTANHKKARRESHEEEQEYSR